MKITSGILVFLLTLFLIGCQAIVPMASLEQDAEAKLFSSDPEWAVLISGMSLLLVHLLPLN